MARLNKFASVNLNDTYGMRPRNGGGVSAAGRGSGVSKHALPLQGGMLILTRPGSKPSPSPSPSPVIPSPSKPLPGTVPVAACDPGVSPPAGCPKGEGDKAVGPITAKSEVYTPPAMRQLALAGPMTVEMNPAPPLMNPPRQAQAVLRGEEFPTLKATLIRPPTPPQHPAHPPSQHPPQSPVQQAPQLATQQHKLLQISQEATGSPLQPLRPHFKLDRQRRNPQSAPLGQEEEERQQKEEPSLELEAAVVAQGGSIPNLPPSLNDSSKLNPSSPPSVETDPPPFKSFRSRPRSADPIESARTTSNAFRKDSRGSGSTPEGSLKDDNGSLRRHESDKYIPPSGSGSWSSSRYTRPPYTHGGESYAPKRYECSHSFKVLRGFHVDPPTANLEINRIGHSRRLDRDLPETWTSRRAPAGIGGQPLPKDRSVHLSDAVEKDLLIPSPRMEDERRNNMEEEEEKMTEARRKLEPEDVLPDGSVARGRDDLLPLLRPSRPFLANTSSFADRETKVVSGDEFHAIGNNDGGRRPPYDPRPNRPKSPISWRRDMDTSNGSGPTSKLFSSPYIEGGALRKPSGNGSFKV